MLLPRRGVKREMAERHPLPLLGGERVVLGHPARADQQDGAGGDIAALGCGADVDPLPFAAGG